MKNKWQENLVPPSTTKRITRLTKEEFNVFPLNEGCPKKTMHRMDMCEYT
ncbi:hypothetical protein [Paenisporosarcina indica]|nr:hypothetical protein [Paenisporosarcina indica]